MISLLGFVGALLVINVIFAGMVLLLRVRSNGRAKRYDRIEGRWEPVIVGIVGGSGEPVPDVPDDEVRHVLEIAARFARRLKGHELESVRRFSSPYVDRLLEDLRDPSPEKRGAAVDKISVLALDSHAEYIVSALDDPSSRVSLVAARALSHPNRLECTVAVLDRLHRYAHWSPSLISTMLAQVGPGALNHLRAYLGDESRPSHERAVVAGSLRLLRDPHSAHIAANALESEDAELVVACLRLIDAVGSKEQAQAVRPLVDHPAFFVRSEAVSVLSHIGDATDVEAITRNIYHDSPWVTIRAARALLELGQRQLLMSLAMGDGLAAESAREVLYEEAA
ncbi:MAG: hypothetical protein M3094_04495 [Actinomycetia bacterium]|nr:hypothetical protein [Actinomycetes bacterium]